jgi:acetyl-CoA carboxylase biotin carboxylase subunit
MGISTVAVASAADLDAAWLAEVDQVVPLGAAKASASYLDQDALLEVARHTRCAAVHPGWGFLSENPVFAARCEQLGLTLVGPPAEAMRRMADKAEARRTMKALGMPVIPGSDGPVGDAGEARRLADEVGYPVLLKAVAGGGGRGMRGVAGPEEIESAWQEASAEAEAAFGDGRLYLEKRIEHGRHVEVQVIADRYGTALHLGERECSLQRRHQKVLEEAPSPGLPAAERARVLPLVADVVARLGYRNAGTIEMLLDREGRLYFMEMNTRLQVEHPVTELITGVDLVELQLRVAANEPLPLSQADVTVRGHAIEARINAEDPDDGFRPSPGAITVLEWPAGDGIRVDTHLRGGDRISPHYDSMIGKLVAHGPTREVAIDRLRAALAATRVEGVKTNVGLHQRILGWRPFLDGRYDTTSLERDLVS